VKFLEAGLEQAKHAESGRNRLITQTTALQEETKHLRHRLEKRHAEAMEWRENRRLLEEDNSRLSAELHNALSRGTRLETDNRRKDSLLAEARNAADIWAQRRLTLEAELRHKNQLLFEAEREKQRAWQTTNASAETAKSAMMRAEAAAKEASDLRNSRGGFNRQDVIRSMDVGAPASEGQRRNVRSQSLADAVAAAATAAAVAAASAADGGGGPEATRHGYRPTERDQSLPRKEGGRGRARSMSPDRGRSMDRTITCCKNSVVPHIDNKLGQNPSANSREGSKDKSGRALRIHPLAVAAADQTADATIFNEGSKTTDTWRNDTEKLPLPMEIQDALVRATTPPGTRRRMCTVFETPSPVAQSAGRDGDKQRHDSDGVRGALTGASPAWTDASFLTGAASPRATASFDDRGYGTHGDRMLGGITSFGVDDAGSVTRISGGSEEGQSGSRESEAHGKDNIVYAEGATGEARLGRKERAGVDPSSAASTGWDRGGISPRVSPAAPAGQRRGRDSMSSRRSSLSGAGVGVTAVLTNGENGARRIGLCNKSENDRRPSSNVGTTDDAQGNGDSRVQKATGDGSLECRGSPPEYSTAYSVGASSVSWAGGTTPAASVRTKASRTDCRESTGPGSPARSLTVSLASLLGKDDSPRASAQIDKAHRESRRSAPFATDEVEDELRPLREVERRLMLLQMEMSQLEAEQSKLAPKASKTMQARAQMRELDSRIASLANESSKLRRVVREKPWRL
ncbi:unnamed protein product, partial [Hapterophycus canaliculatus]